MAAAADAEAAEAAEEVVAAAVAAAVAAVAVATATASVQLRQAMRLQQAPSWRCYFFARVGESYSLSSRMLEGELP